MYIHMSFTLHTTNIHIYILAIAKIIQPTHEILILITSMTFSSARYVSIGI